MKVRDFYDILKVESREQGIQVINEIAKNKRIVYYNINDMLDNEIENIYIDTYGNIMIDIVE